MVLKPNEKEVKRRTKSIGYLKSCESVIITLMLLTCCRSERNVKYENVNTFIVRLGTKVIKSD